MRRPLPVALAVGLLLALGCMSRPQTDHGEEGAAAPAGSDFLTWRKSGAAPMTTWVAEGVGVVHPRAGLVLPGGDALWQLDVVDAPFPTLDCACYDPFDLPASEAGRAEQRVRCTRDTPLAGAMLRQVNGDRLVPLLADLPDDRGTDPAVFEGTLARAFEPMGSVGPWLFLARRDTVYTCGAPKPLDRWTFQVIDAARQAPSTIFSPAELARIEAEEKVEAARALCVAPDCFQPKPDATTLTRYWPAFGDDGRLVLKLQFTTEAALSAGDDAWDSGTRSVVVDAKAIPAALAPYDHAPAPIVELWKLGGVPAPGGWAPVGERMRKAFGG